MKKSELIELLKKGKIRAELRDVGYGQCVEVFDNQGNIWDRFYEGDLAELCLDYVLRRWQEHRDGEEEPLGKEE